jgi:hypothetical protein
MVRKSTKKQGDFMKCLKCNAVVTEEGIAGDTAAAAKKAVAKKAGARRPAGAGAGRASKGKTSPSTKGKDPQRSKGR